MTHTKIGRAALALAWLLGFADAVAQELKAKVDRASLFEGETVTLTVTLDRDPGTAQPDFSPLASDFLVGDTSMSSQFSLVNGRRSMTVSWSVVLEPKQAGEFTMPPLRLGNLVTDPVMISVLPRSQSDADDDIFLEMEAGPSDPYVHAQVQLTLKLYHREALTEGRLFEPDIPHAVVERLGEDVTYTATLGDARYRVLERRFALFPERSGSMTIPAATFRGRVADSRSGFNSIFDRGRRVSVASQPLTLNVRPVPSAASGMPWIPAAELSLEEFWPEGGARFVVGEPATRTLVLKAKGLLSPQVPELELPRSEQLKIYPDQAQTQTRTDGRWVFAEREQSYAIVPTTAGTVTLPALRIAWWNTVDDRLEHAEIPAREIQVAAPSGAPPGTPTVVTADTTQSAVTSPGPWRNLALALGVMWLVTLGAWFRERARPRRNLDPEVKKAAERIGNARKALRAACHASQPAEAAAALLRWAQQAPQLGSPRTLPALANALNDPGWRRELGALERVLYASGDPHWNGENLWKLASAGWPPPPKKSSAARSTLLPALFSR